MKKQMSAAWRRCVTVAGAAALVLLAPAAHADFSNGDFASGDFTDWTQSSYVVPNSGIPAASFPPQTEADLGLTASGTAMSAVLPAGSAATTNGALAWSGYAARVHDEVNGINRRVSAIEQTITVAPGDVDPDGKVHVRFSAAPVLQDPNHDPEQQPYFFIEITDSSGNSLFHTYNFANEVGVPWSTFGGRTFTDWQAFDVALDPSDVGVNDQVTLKVIAAGCSPSAHAGAVYLKDVRTAKQLAGAHLWVTATGPASACAGRTVTYTYTYENNGDVPMSNVEVEAVMPQTNDPLPTEFVGISNPSFGGGSCAAPADPTDPTDPAVCTIGTLQPGQSGTFSMTVRVPAAATGTSLGNGNYTISGEDASTTPATAISQLGPLVRSTLGGAACLAAPTPVPTLGQWGLLLLSLLAAGLGMVTIRRRLA